MIEFQTNKNQLLETRLYETPSKTLEDGQIKLDINHFSFTANNVTYAVLGEQFRYWQFFPAANADDTQHDWGIIPTWGYATVSESMCEQIKTGELYFGYFPAATSVIMTPGQINQHTFIDEAAHRKELPQGYNVYRRQHSAPETRQQQEQMLLFPLLVTAFSLHDYLRTKQWFESTQIIIGSASSKTALGLAYACQDDQSAPDLIGLTSTRNIETVKDMSVYQQVLDYQQLDQLDLNRPSLIVDMSANQPLLIELQKLLGDNLKSCVNVGLTHWQDSKSEQALAQSSVFFAPDQIERYIEQHGQQAFNQQSQAFIESTAIKMRSWLTMREANGLESLQQLYPQVCDGSFPANQGLIVAP